MTQYLRVTKLTMHYSKLQFEELLFPAATANSRCKAMIQNVLHPTPCLIE